MMIARILCYQAIAVLLVTSAKEKKNGNVHRVNIISEVMTMRLQLSVLK